MFTLTASGLALFAVLGTIFGEKTLADAGFLRKIVVPSIYNVALAGVVLPLFSWALGVREQRNLYRA